MYKCNEVKFKIFYSNFDVLKTGHEPDYILISLGLETQKKPLKLYKNWCLPNLLTIKIRKTNINLM